MIKKTLVLFFATYLIISQAIAQAPKSYSSSEILLQLKKLNTVGAVLYIAAHPDDENTRLITYLANEKCLRTGYLSLTRGDGGQNLIGPEQGIELGVIRTQELLAARRIDGGEQFFTRAYDFGFSKSPEETFKKWNKDSILSDMVWVIRNFRPDIIITRFAPDGSGGHGHHTASAILAEEAFDAAADPTRFPEQLQYVEVWKTRRMFYNTVARFRNPNADMSAYIPLDVGGYNPLLGKSYGEIAAESRSMHKSQGFGSAKQRGEYFEHFKPVKGDTANLKSIFDGMDFTWKRVKGGEKIEKLVDEAIRKFDAEKPDKSIMQIENIANKVWSYGRHWEAYSIFINCYKLYFEATFDQYNISNTDLMVIPKIQIVNQSSNAIEAHIKGYKSSHKIDLNIKAGESNILKDTFPIESSGSDFLIKNQGAFWTNFNIKDNLFDIPYGYDRTAADASSTDDKYFLLLTRTKNSNQGGIVMRSYPQYKWVDPEKGELYRPVVITPPVMINLTQKSLVFTDETPKEIKVFVKAGKDNVKAKMSINLPRGWIAELKSENDEIYLQKKGDEQSVSFFVQPLKTAGSFKETETTFIVSAEIDGIEYTKGIKEIKYDHIPIQTLFPEAEVKLVKLDIKTKSKRIGYIPGAGDEVQACLSQLGYEVTTLTDDKLASENLSQYDAIITGVRAYNTNDKLPIYKQKLMGYVAAGGNMIVQYNTNSWAGPLSKDIGPYPFKITRDRITDETAKVVMDLPNHAVFNTPNKITEKDFDGWIQERSIYHASEWDSNYVAPISMADPNEKANNGALIIAKHGKGNFVYTGLVFFRELPAGVPGAYRLLVNLIELGK